MPNAIRTRIVRIGNSQGVRIPKALIEQAGLRDDVEIRLDDSRLIISAARHPRSGWQDAFQAMAEQHRRCTHRRRRPHAFGVGSDRMAVVAHPI